MLERINAMLLRGGDVIEAFLPEWFTAKTALILIVLCGFWLLVIPL